MNSILEKDIKEIALNSLIDWSKLKNKKILITGATGLICSIMIKAMEYRNRYLNLNLTMYLLVRNKEDAEKIFGNNENIKYIEKNVEDIDNVNFNIDYIIHGASPTKSKFFIENPVETLDTSIIGTRKVLELAKTNNIKSMVYLSSMEMYGTMNSNNVEEDDLGYINPLEVRSSYSEGKRVGELYCYSFFSEFNLPVKIGRIAQTFGAGISKNESRVYKVFADAIINKKDIVLKSSGSTIINFSYTTDTILGLIYILLNGKNGEAYNIVGDKTNMTILESAKWLVEEFGTSDMNVIVEIPKENAGFAPDNKMVLSNEKMKKIGWNCKYDIKDGYRKLIEYLLEEKNNNN